MVRITDCTGDANSIDQAAEYPDIQADLVFDGLGRLTLDEVNI